MAPTPEELADFMAARAKQQPKVQQVIREARLYDSLRENEAWQRLAQRVRDSRDGFLASLARRLMSGGKVSPEEIAYMRGFYYGARWIIEHPEKAEESLERAARAAWRMTLIEAAEIAESDSPYIDTTTQEG